MDIKEFIIPVTPKAYDTFQYKNQDTGETKTFVLVPADEHKEPCKHENVEGIEWLPDLYVCSDCHQLIAFEGGEKPFRPASADELEARIYRALQPAFSALNEISSAMYDASRILELEEAIQGHNPVLIQERKELREKFEARLKERLRGGK